MQNGNVGFIVAITLFTLCGSALAGVETDPVDMTGTWQGAIRCKGLDQVGEKTRQSSVGTLLVTNSGSGAAMAFLSDGRSRGGISADLCGYTIQQSGQTGKGQGAFQEAATGGLRAQTLHLKTIKVFDEKPNGQSGIAKGTSIWSPDGSGTTAACTWLFRRVSQVDPVVVFGGC